MEILHRKEIYTNIYINPYQIPSIRDNLIKRNVS